MRTTEILCGVSIPQSGLQAFRPVFNQGYPLDVVVSIPQSGLQAFRLGKLLCGLGSHNRFNPSIGLTSVPTLPTSDRSVPGVVVSIPQSGLQAFRPKFVRFQRVRISQFQSLNRAYKRSDEDLKELLPIV